MMPGVVSFIELANAPLNSTTILGRPDASTAIAVDFKCAGTYSNSSQPYKVPISRGRCTHLIIVSI